MLRSQDEVATMKRTKTLPVPEQRTLEAIDSIVRRAGVRAVIDAAAGRVEKALLAAPGAQMAWETVPLSTFEPGLPETIRSSWVFILRDGAMTGAERHPNSVQRTLSWRGSGDLMTRTGGRWTSHRLASDGRAPLGRRWIGIPAGTWHQVVVRGGHWVVLSFHTARAEDLIEERPGEDAARTGRRRHYLGESAR
jgi:hypothetical protein